MTSHVCYILTLFADDLTDNRWVNIHEVAIATNNIHYICSQLEKCPTTGRPHWQAFVKLKNKQRGSWLKQHIDPRLHFQDVTVARAEAINYGKKDETRLKGPLEFGTPPKAVDRHEKGGQRTQAQWDEIRKVVVNNDRLAVPTDIVIKYNLEKRFDGLRRFWTVDERHSLPTFLPNPWGWVLPSRLQTKKRHLWIFSRMPNRGKTTGLAKPLSEKYRCYLKSGDFSYWSLVGNEEAVILDDFNTAMLKWNILNLMCDGTYEYRIFQGGVKSLKDPLIIVLSNQSIADLYPFMNSTLYARFIEKEIL